jgi:hypothetical protein
VKLWLVVVMDKDQAGEPDVGMSVVEGNEKAAHAVMRLMEDAYRAAKKCRCVGRYREIERSKQYRAAALIRTRP